MTRPRPQRGFTLIEAIIVIVISGIVAGVVAAFIGGPVRGFVDSGRRAQLVDAAELALRRMARDLRRALPNSVRIDATDTVLELMHTVDAARYRDDPPPGAPPNVLSFTAADAEFDVIGALQNFAEIDTANDSLVIYNLTATGPASNAYVGDNRAALAPGTTATHIQLAAATLFPQASPRQRFFVIDTPVTYLCDLGNETLTRYDGYAINASQSAVDTDAELLAAGAVPALVSRHVSACTFRYQPGTSQRAGLVTLRLVLSDQGETVTLMHQVHVYNTP